MVGALLDRMERWLVANRPEYFEILQPGAKDDSIDRFEARFAVKLPTAFRQFYRWRNGQDPGSFDPLQGNRLFSSLEDIADTKDMLDGMIGSDFEDPRYWRRGWIPFLHNGGGSHLCLDLAAEDGGRLGQLIGFWKGDQDRPVEFLTTEAWLDDLVSSMENGTLELL